VLIAERTPLAARQCFVCQMQGSWVSIKGAGVPADC